MIEGKLKELIKDFIGHGILDGKDVPYPKYEKISTIDIVNRFLDEAKKEFQNAFPELKSKDFMSQIHKIVKEIGDTGTEVTAYYKALIIIEKWFGDSE